MTATTLPVASDIPITDPDAHLAMLLGNATRGAAANPQHCVACLLWTDLARLVLAMHAHLAGGGCLPTEWAADATATDDTRTVADVHLPCNCACHGMSMSGICGTCCSDEEPPARDAAWWEARASDIAAALAEAASSIAISLDGDCGDCQVARNHAFRCIICHAGPGQPCRSGTGTGTVYPVAVHAGRRPGDRDLHRCAGHEASAAWLARFTELAAELDATVPA